MAALLVATSAAAETDPNFTSGPRWYGSFGVGYHWPYTVNSTSTRPAADGAPYNWQWHTKSDVAMAATIGYRLTPHVRMEIETGYYNSTLTSVHAPGANAGGLSASRPSEPYGLCATTSAPGGCLSAGHEPHSWTWMWTGFVNAIYDVRPDRKIDPFVGVGLGFAHVEWAGDALSYNFSKVPGVISPTNPAIQTLKDAGTLNRPSQFAIQLLGGVSYRLSPRLHLDATYYHYLTPTAMLWNPMNNTPGLPGGAGVQPGNFRGKFQDDSTIVSLRYGF